jgi:serine/threonine protein kinase
LLERPDWFLTGFSPHPEVHRCRERKTEIGQLAGLGGIVSDEVPGDADGLTSEVAGFGAGSRIAGYRLEEQIGRGGMAVVFRARDERLGRLVALKILAPALAADEAFRQRFIRESQAAAAVDDPHIIPVFEAGEASGVLFIAMRYVPGSDMRTLVRRDGPLSAMRTAAVISPVASALDAAHAAGLVHRDVKPANMLMDARPGRPDHVYLSDFGLSKGTTSSVGLTGTGQFLGTLEYISPEQIEGKPVDGRADEYALACTAFELLTGSPPFRRDEAMAVMYAQLSAPPPLLTSRRSDLPPAANQVFAKALAKAPADRYANCRGFADALRAAFLLQPYDSGPGLIPAGDHPPTRIASQSAQDSAHAGATTVGTQAEAVSPVPAIADMPTGKASIPGRLTADRGGADPGGAGPDGDRGGHEPFWRSRHIPVALVIIAAIAILAVAGVVAARLLASPSHHGSASGPAPRPASFPITAKSDVPPVSGDVLVVYQGGKDATAQISGDIKGATSGEVAKLYAQQFPFTSAPAPAGSVILNPTGTTAKVAFQVSPSLATRYVIKLFRSSTAATPLASSVTRTVYVTVTATSGKSRTCSRPVCHETFHLREFVPASVLHAELPKQWYPYFGLRLAAAKAPASPGLLLLGAGGAHVTQSRRISAGEFDLTITFSFQVANHAYSWNWSACAKDTEAADGIGLPVPHDCGSQRVHASAAYLG